MSKKLTVTVDDEVYEGLYRRVGRRKISRFLENLARPHVVDADLEAASETWPQTKLATLRPRTGPRV